MSESPQTRPDLRGRQVLHRVVWITSAVGIIAAVLTFNRAEESVEAVADWKTYDQPDGKFAIEGPANWECQLSKSRGLVSTIALKRTQSIYIRATADNMVLGPMVDMARATRRSGQGLGLPELPSTSGTGTALPATGAGSSIEAGIHEAAKKQLKAASAPDFEESEPKFLSVGSMGAAVSDYAYSESGQLGARSKVCGRRATIVGNAIAYTVVCQCPEASWETLEPSFQRVIESFKVASQ